MPTAVADVVEADQPLKVILFGSAARGDEGPDSDLDLLVVLDEIDPAECERRKDVVGSLHYWPLREGRVVYERAA